MMEGYFVKKIGQNRGRPRVWLEGNVTERAGLTTGQRYDIVIKDISDHDKNKMIVLQANPDGSRVVSGKMIGEKDNPIIDINSQALLAIFDGMAAIRVVVKKGEIYFLPLATELKKKERFERLRAKLESGEPLAIGSVAHGGGILSHAVHSGLNEAGIKTHLAFANEIREELLQHASIHNDAWSDNTQILSAPLQELAFDTRGLASVPVCDIFESGISCSGHSKAGKSKRGLKSAEAHPEVGHLIVGALIILGRVNPAIAIWENVPQFAQSASADILRNTMRDMGYTTSERILNGKEWGSLENRDRWCLVAVTHGVDFSFDDLHPPTALKQVVGDILDSDISNDDPRWRPYTHLIDKEVRDAAKGNSFSMQIVSSKDDTVPTLRKGYAKAGSSDCLLRNEVDPTLLRQFTSAEHARIKGCPQELVSGLAESIAHQVLGQGIVYAPFKDLGRHIGDSLNDLANRNFVSETNSLHQKPLVEPVQAIDTSAAQAALPDSNPVMAQQQFSLLDVVVEGTYSGKVLSVQDGVVTQKINRAGDTVQHEIARLSIGVSPGDIVDINYKNGSGSISNKAVSLER